MRFRFRADNPEPNGQDLWLNLLNNGVAPNADGRHVGYNVLRSLCIIT